MRPFLLTTAITALALLAVVALLHLFPRLGRPGKAFSAWLCHAPGLDLLVTVLTILPLVIPPAIAGWQGLAGGVLAQFTALFTWTLAHELSHWVKNPAARKGDRILKVHADLIGLPRSIFLLILMSIGVPVFWLVRCVELIVYPFLIRLANFPRYNQAEWVNVSRHKFPHLIGHDRIWCLYCDWMTGLWSLGSEMLRNVESFWCPVRFSNEAKCANCVREFPDTNHGWAQGDAHVAGAVARQKYITDRPPSNSWFGHPTRLTVNGKPTSPPTSPTSPPAAISGAASSSSPSLSE